MTTHAVVLIQDWNGPYQVYYANMDGYPSSLGERLIRELDKYPEIDRTHEPLLAEKAIAKALGLRRADFTLQRHEVSKAFEIYTDLEWIYTIDNFAHQADMLSINIYKTSNLVNGPPFIWQVWGRILKHIDVGVHELPALMGELERIGDATKAMIAAYVESRERT